MTAKQKLVLALASLMLALDPERIDSSSEGTR